MAFNAERSGNATMSLVTAQRAFEKALAYSQERAQFGRLISEFQGIQWMLVFNLLQLFVYRRLKRERKPKDPCDTIISIVAEMLRDVGAIREPIPWEGLANAAMT